MNSQPEPRGHQDHRQQSKTKDGTFAGNGPQNADGSDMPDGFLTIGLIRWERSWEWGHNKDISTTN